MKIYNCVISPGGRIDNNNFISGSSVQVAAHSTKE